MRKLTQTNGSYKVVFVILLSLLSGLLSGELLAHRDVEFSHQVNALLSEEAKQSILDGRTTYHAELIALGDQAHPVLIKDMLASDDHFYVSRILAVLKKSTTNHDAIAEGIRKLLAKWSSEDPTSKNMRRWAVEAIVYMRLEELKNELVGLLDSDDHQAVELALFALGKVGSEKEREIIQEKAEHLRTRGKRIQLGVQSALSELERESQGAER